MDNGLIPREETALVVVDIQEKLFPRVEGHEKILANSLKVIEFCRRLSIPIIVTEQYPSGLGATVPEVQEALGDEYLPIAKTSFSCFGEPGFTGKVHDLDRLWLVFVGIETHVCVAQTVFGALVTVEDDSEEPIGPVVLADCVGSRFAFDHETGLARMRDEGAVITSSDAFFYEMLVEAKTPDHKKVFDLLK
jgi:nicotinamidase-related amidase